MKKFYNPKNWINFSVADAILKMEGELREILSILEEEVTENKKMYWLLTDKCSENVKLKEENKDLKSQLKNRKKEENENN